VLVASAIGYLYLAGDPGGGLLTFFLFGIFHFLPGNPKALTVPNVQLHLMEDVLDDVGRLSESKSQIIRINQPSRGGDIPQRCPSPKQPCTRRVRLPGQSESGRLAMPGGRRRRTTYEVDVFLHHIPLKRLQRQRSIAHGQHKWVANHPLKNGSDIGSFEEVVDEVAPEPRQSDSQATQREIKEKGDHHTGKTAGYKPSESGSAAHSRHPARARS
jgi:hypothetical protein